MVPERAAGVVALTLRKLPNACKCAPCSTLGLSPQAPSPSINCSDASLQVGFIYTSSLDALVDVVYSAFISVTTDLVSEVMAANGVSAYNDWQGRYNHVDQILERPGPRTDESFGAGDAVSALFGLSPTPIAY